MSNFQHSTAKKSASLRSIFDTRSIEWVTWECNSDGICCDISYDWGYWYIRSYISDNAGSQYTVIRYPARSLTTLRRKINLLKESYRLNHIIFIDQFLTAHFGAFHMYDTDLSNRWVKDVY